MLKNHVGLILDESGSMSSIKKGAIEATNGIIDAINSESSKHKQRTELTLLQFSNTAEFKYKSVNIKKAQKLTNNSYRPEVGGMTALFDAVGKLIEYYKNLSDYEDEECSFVITVITDGKENLSQYYNSYSLTQLLKEVHKTNRWTVTFQVPKGDKTSLLGFGIPSDNIREWQTGTEEGTREVKTSTSFGFSNYFTARSAGKTKLDTFYLTTDLSKVDNKTVRQMEDLSKDFKVYTVPKEAVIKQFVESKTYKTYVPGEAYYQVMKAELIQASKQVIIMDKSTGKLYGGDDARQLLGLKPGSNVKLNPGNHANWELFCESRSNNRKLPRGTKLLIKT